MNLTIITPEAKIFEGEVSSITLPGLDGSFQALDHHAALLSLLKDGMVEYIYQGKNKKTHISSGVVEVLNKQVILLADSVIN